MSFLFVGCGTEQVGTDAVDNAFITITGEAVVDEVQLTLADLKGMADSEFEADYFAINTYGTKEYFQFKGVWIWPIIEQYANWEKATTVSIIAEDGYTVEYTLEEMQRDDYVDEENPDTKYKVIIAWEENGVEYRLENGNPFRFVIGQKEPGDVNKPYWVQNVAAISVD